MMRHLLRTVAWAAGCSLLAVSAAMAQAVPGQPAPQFTLSDLAGKRVSLADYRGRWVVLEWTNPNCPFVVKHYGSGNMQALQKRFTADNVAWLVINSTAPAHPDFMDNAAQAAWIRQQAAVPTAVLADPTGAVGKAYAARTTPHMFVIDPQGKIVYAGGIDDKRSANPSDIKSATNFVAQALSEGRAGKPVSVAAAPPYGCSVKYAD